MVRNFASDNALIKASKAGDRDECVRLLKYKFFENKWGKSKKTAVMEAAKGGHLDIVELLFEHGAYIFGRDYDKNTILMLASKGVNMKI